MFVSTVHKGIALIAFGALLLLHALGRISGTQLLIGVSVIIILVGCHLVADHMMNQRKQ